MQKYWIIAIFTEVSFQRLAALIIHDKLKQCDHMCDIVYTYIHMVIWKLVFNQTKYPLYLLISLVKSSVVYVLG